MNNGISQSARTEVLNVLHQRYQAAGKKEKTKILDELVTVAQCHRKHAVRLLRHGADTPTGRSAVAGRRIYDEAVREALIVAWEAADQICVAVNAISTNRFRRFRKLASQSSQWMPKRKN